MLVIPAVDLKDRKVVRLYKGDFDKVSVYSEDPVEVAKGWADKGASRIHVVDLDGAQSGALKNVDALKGILGAVKCSVQFGGGIRDSESLDRVMDLGTHACILSTAVFEDIDMVRTAVKKYGDKILVSVDTQEGLVRSRGWQGGTPVKVEEAAKTLKGLGIGTVIHTNVSRDGTLQGLDLDEIRRFLKRSGLKSIVAGGVGSVEDIRALKECEAEGVVGVIVGRALYEGRVDLEEAIKLC